MNNATTFLLLGKTKKAATTVISMRLYLKNVFNDGLIGTTVSRSMDWVAHPIQEQIFEKNRNLNWMLVVNFATTDTEKSKETTKLKKLGEIV